MLYDATAKRETVKISNTAAPGAALLQDNSDYQLFVNGKEQICVMQVRHLHKKLTNHLLLQSAPEAPSGRHINVYTYSVSLEIDLDLGIIWFTWKLSGHLAVQNKP